MGFRYRKSFQILPGVNANVSNNGIRFSFGGRSAKITTGKNGTYLNVGIPGTGINYRKKLSSSASNKENTSLSSNYAENQQYIEQYQQQFNKLIFPHKDIYGVSPMEKYSSRLNELTDSARIEKLSALIYGDNETMCNAIDLYASSIESDYSLAFCYQLNGNKILCDIQLPDISELPTEYPTLLKSGEISHKKYTQTALKENYYQMVLSLAITIGANLFNLTPFIREVVLSGTNKVRDKVGDLTDQYIYSFIFDRETFENTVFSEIDNPYEFVLKFANRINTTVSFTFKKIMPFGDGNNQQAETVDNTATTVEALQSLGYKISEINKILPELRMMPFQSDEDYIKKALQLLRQK